MEDQQELPDEWFDQVNLEMAAEVADTVRRVAKERLGSNCTFADDDVFLMGVLAQRAVLAGLHTDFATRDTMGISEPLTGQGVNLQQRNMEVAAEASRSAHEESLGFSIVRQTRDQKE